MPETSRRRKRSGLLLTNEHGMRRKNPSWRLVAETVSQLDPGDGNSFCILEAAPDNNYVQVLRGLNGNILEWRITAPDESYTHYRACYPGASRRRAKLEKHDGSEPAQQRDLLHVEDVLNGFEAFCRGEPMPPWLEWRVMEI